VGVAAGRQAAPPHQQDEGAAVEPRTTPPAIGSSRCYTYTDGDYGAGARWKRSLMRLSFEHEVGRKQTPLIFAVCGVGFFFEMWNDILS
jgi:hypothetical protein